MWHMVLGCFSDVRVDSDAFFLLFVHTCCNEINAHSTAMSIRNSYSIVSQFQIAIASLLSRLLGGYMHIYFFFIMA